MLLFLKAGHRMEKTELCPPRFYEMMEKCWYADPAARPTWPVLVSSVEYILRNRNHQLVS